MNTQDQVIDSLPAHLRPFVAYQDYQQYTPRDRAVWRFMLEQLSRNLKHAAHPTYLNGLTKMGITSDAIPKIEEINQCLKQYGWRAVAVDGVLPAAISMEFQATRILALAVNIRSLENMLYTHAPDIIHDAAGLAPLLSDIDYSEFFQRIGQLGMRALNSRQDLKIYEAYHRISMIKESANHSEDEILRAEQELKIAIDQNSAPSESALLTRLHRWTVEYGLIGDLKNNRICGAGLLSSLSEDINWVNDSKVVKRYLTVDAINNAHDPTLRQPQVFVAESYRHLSQILEELGRNMASSIGGLKAMDAAIQAATLATITTNSGIEISGQVLKLQKDAAGNLVYFNTTGGTQLAYKNQQLAGQDTSHHARGFGSPIGRLRGFERCLSSYSIDELKRHNIELDSACELNFISGIRVTGVITNILRRDQKNILFTFSECTVRDRKGEILFDPSWGVYDMAVGDRIVSVYAGTADKSTFPVYEAPSSQVTLTQLFNEEDERLFRLYNSIRNLRINAAENNVDEVKCITTVTKIANSQNIDWLLTYEALELASIVKLSPSICQKLNDNLVRTRNRSEQNTRTLIAYALDSLPDSETDSNGRWSV